MNTIRRYRQLTPNIEETTIEHNGELLVFLNGVLQQVLDHGKFIAARGPLDGKFMLIIADYAHWVVNQEDIESWIDSFTGTIRQEGMVVHFDNDIDRTAFLLKWG